MSNLPQTAADLFDTLLPFGLDSYPERAREIGGVIAFNILGDQGGLWTLDCLGTPPKIHKGEAPTAAQCTIELSQEDFKLLWDDYNKGMDLYFENRIRITGDTSLCLKLALFFEITRPNPG